MNNEDEILTIRKASEYLHIGVYSLYRLAKAGQIPAKRVEKAWRFTRKDLCTWIADSPFNRRIRTDRREDDHNIMSPDRRCGKDRRK